jgi:hypothetical protein
MFTLHPPREHGVPEMKTRFVHGCGEHGSESGRRAGLFQAGRKLWRSATELDKTVSFSSSARMQRGRR